MFTLFDLFRLLGPLFGLTVGFDAGHHFGTVGCLVGAIAGGYLGLLAGRFPLQLSDWFAFRLLRKESTPQLWSDLKDESYLMPNYVLLELKRRGEPMAEALNLVLSMLTSDDRPRRLRGFAAFLSGFPELAGRMNRYNPDAPDAERREAVNNFKSSLSKGTGPVAL